MNREELLIAYGRMSLIRAMEERIAGLYREGLIPGFVHTSVGQEAVAVGTLFYARPDDVITSTHRGHGHVLAKGLEPRRMMAELMGRQDGACAGRGGSMHVADPALGIFGANGIVGAGLPIAVGAAHALRRRGLGQIVIAFFGDGAIATGAFHESLNLAALWRLPVIFLCENNGFSEFSRTPDQHPVPIQRRADGYGVPFCQVPGNDVAETAELIRDALEQVRAGDGPVLVEATTLRVRGHYEGDQQRYRDQAEFAAADSQDPLVLARMRLAELGASPEQADELDRQAAAAVADAEQFARLSPEPAPEHLLDHVIKPRPALLPTPATPTLAVTPPTPSAQAVTPPAPQAQAVASPTPSATEAALSTPVVAQSDPAAQAVAAPDPVMPGPTARIYGMHDAVDRPTPVPGGGTAPDSVSAVIGRGVVGGSTNAVMKKEVLNFEEAVPSDPVSVSRIIRQALYDAMAEDPAVFLAGIDVGGGNVFGLTRGLKEQWPDRVLDTPIAETALMGLAVGSAMAGLRPVVELMYLDFLGVCLDQIMNQAAKLRYMTGGAVTLPLVIRTQFGAGRSSGSQHSQSLETLLAHIPGLTVVMPSSGEDTYGLLRTAIADDNPVVFIENRLLYERKARPPDPAHRVPFGQARIARPGRDVTIVAWSRMVELSLDAAAGLAAEGIEAEVLDLRTIVPLDRAAILASLHRTNRLVIAQEAVTDFGAGAEIAALAVREGFWSLDAPVARVGAPRSPAPYAPSLERAWMPGVAGIVAAARELANSGAAASVSELRGSPGCGGPEGLPAG